MIAKTFARVEPDWTIATRIGGFIEPKMLDPFADAASDGPDGPPKPILAQPKTL
jgi:hypothetical protein